MLASAFTAETDTTTLDDAGHDRTTTSKGLLVDQLAAGSVRTVEAKEHVFLEGDAAAHVYMVQLGHICVYRTLSDGRRQIVDFAYPGDIIGLGSVGEYSHSAQATTRTRLRSIPTGALEQAVARDGRLGLKLYEALSRELIASRELLFTVSQRTAEERVAAFLLALSRRNQRNGEAAHEFVLPMTRGDIADFLGLTIETVSRMFTKLRTDGVIDLAQCVLVTIVDHGVLAARADGRR